MNGNNENRKVPTSRGIIKSMKKKADVKRRVSEKIADFMSSFFGSIGFLTLNVLWFLIWIIWNMNLIPGLVPFDPFPFGLLTMIVSLEAIVLSIFVLISQNRVSKIDDLREEIDLQVDIITEQELTKLMEMVALLMQKQGIDVSKDKTLQEMLKPTNMEKIERALEKEVVYS